MKFIIVALVALAVGVNAVPKSAEARFVDNIVIGAINDLSESIQEHGLDPLYVKDETYEYKLPVTDLLKAQAHVVDFLFEGASNIRINSIDFSIFALRLRFDISLPAVSARVGSATGNVVLGNSEASGEASGTLTIEEVNISGVVLVSIGLGGVTIRDVTTDFTVKDIRSNLNVEIFNRDISDFLNTSFNEKIPNFLNEHKTDIDTLLAHLIRSIAEEEL